MPIPENQIQAAQAVQQQAAHSASAQIRLIAGPGTGKSSAIEQRVCWLLNQGAPASRVYAVSFTRASSRDLEERIRAHCHAQGQAAAAEVRVSTLHSLALRTLRRADLLTRYPVDPLVLDDWELENIFDAEFGAACAINSKSRRENIRRYHEANWSTGLWNPPIYLPPDPPISDAESQSFLGFHGPRSQAYSCVLPGEIVRQCVHEMNAGNIDPVTLLHIEHLIVDEFQDLNPMDLDFVNGLITRGANVFVAGDDDQSIYSFRFANPSGIQNFHSQYPAAALYTLNECFRCMAAIVAAANSLLAAFPAPQRIPKNLASLYRHSAPAANGVVHRWRFASEAAEASGIADSCRDLIQAGTNPRDILILLSNRRALGPVLEDALQRSNVPFDPPRGESFLDTAAGRLVLALFRVVGNSDDYVAHRTLLGVRSGVGTGTCNQVCAAIVNNGLNFKDIFYRPLPTSVFSGRSLTAINHARSVCAHINTWQDSDAYGHRRDEILDLIATALSTNEAQAWQNYAASFPVDMTLDELRQFLWADNDEQQAHTMATVYTRLGQVVPADQVLPPRVRVMTMHGAKGLSAHIVLIPGLEDNLIPGPWRNPYPGLVLEAARLLYVSITRARAACILSFATRRFINGRNQIHTPSRFAASLNGAFVQRGSGLGGSEVKQIINECAQI